jgi:Mrp family chromosome partitioning ATPase
MIALRKRNKHTTSQAEPTVLRSADGVSLTIFSDEIIANYRHMITELRYQGQFPDRIALVSALSGEGVTYNALAMGTTLATDISAKTCVVELNWWRPGLFAQLGEATSPSGKGLFRKRVLESPAETGALSHTPGLSAVLAGEAMLEDVLIRTHLPNLDLLPAGELSAERRPAVARSDELKALIAGLSETYDHVLIDTPAVLMHSDTIALAALAGHACLVVRQGVTPVNLVRQALDELKHVNMLGIIMNQFRIHTPRFIYDLIPQE